MNIIATDFTELKNADEAFITGSSKGIVPVVQIEKTSIGNGKVGEMTRMLTRLFEKETEQLRKRINK